MKDRRSSNGSHLPLLGMLSLNAPALQAFCLGRAQFPAR